MRGTSETSVLREKAQELLRQIAFARDGVCVMSNYPETGKCGGYRKDGELILQAEHLLSRSNSATFGDMRNIVLLCKYHHIFWKPKNSLLYWKLIPKIIGRKRWLWLQRCREDRTAHKIDLILILLDLQQQLNN